MFISQVHTHTYAFFNTQDKRDATANGDTSCLSVRYTHTHKHSLFNTQDDTDAMADGETSGSSVR